MTNSPGIFLLQTAVFSSFVLALAFAINFAARKRPAEFRHLIFVIAVGLLLAVPPAALWLPKLTVPVSADFAPFSFASADIQPAMPRASRQLPPPPSGFTEASDLEGRRSDRAERPADSNLDASSLAGIGYLLVTILLLLRLMRRAAIVQARLREMQPHVDAQTEAIVGQIASSMSIDRRVRVLESCGEATPWTWGTFKPVIVVPAEFRNWSRAEQTNALVHELAHIRRHDFLTTVLGQICLALYWFQPLVWLADRAMRREAEYACDDRVATFGASGPDYAGQLLRTAHAIAGVAPPGPLVPAMAGRREFAPRVTRILDSTIRRTAVSGLTRYSSLAIGILVALPLVALRSQPAVESEADTVTDIEAIRVNGPGNETELELLVGTLVESGQEQQAEAAFVDWLTAAGDSFRGCHYCVALLDGADASEAALKQRTILRSALDDVEALARTRAEPRLLMRLVSMLTYSTEVRDLGAYYLLQARALGELSDSEELIAAVFLANSGRYEAGLNIVQQLHQDPDSDYYQSADTRQWIAYMSSRQELMERIEQRLSGDSGVVTATYEYIPAYKEAPQYPAAAREARQEGEVVVQYTVTSTGRTRDATVVESSDSLFDESALQSVANYRYMPRVQNGVATDVAGVRVKILYRLQP